MPTLRRLPYPGGPAPVDLDRHPARDAHHPGQIHHRDQVEQHRTPYRYVTYRNATPAGADAGDRCSAGAAAALLELEVRAVVGGPVRVQRPVRGDVDAGRDELVRVDRASALGLDARVELPAVEPVLALAGVVAPAGVRVALRA